MTPKERVLAACKRQKTDRIPIDYVARKSLSDRLMDDLGIDEFEDLMLRLRVDCRRLEPFYSAGKPVFDVENKLMQSVFGVKSGAKILDNGVEVGYYAFRPLEHAESIDDVMNIDWPGEKDVFIHDFSQQLEDYKDYAILT